MASKVAKISNIKDLYSFGFGKVQNKFYQKKCIFRSNEPRLSNFVI